MKNILVIGASGQIGSELVPALRHRYGTSHVFATDIRSDPPENLRDNGPYFSLDAMDRDAIAKALQTNEIDTIYHLASLLSATGEKLPQKAWDLNINSLLNVLELGRLHKLERIFWPSSIAAFGPSTPRDNTPNETILQPSTMYGVTKVTGELLVEYYWKKYQLDTRILRLPGIISSETPCGGGTTDYAVEIFYEALEKKHYSCFVRPDTSLPMMYMPDLLNGTIQFMETDVSRLHRHVYNFTALSFSVKDLATEIKKHIPDFTIEYKPDFRQNIADSWPRSVDDSLARQEWGWHPQYDLKEMTKDMIRRLSHRLQQK